MQLRVIVIWNKISVTSYLDCGNNVVAIPFVCDQQWKKIWTFNYGYNLKINV